MFVTTEWFSVVKYANHALALNDSVRIAVLRVTMTLREFECYRNTMEQDETDQAPRWTSDGDPTGFPKTGSYYIKDDVPLEHLSVAVMDYDNFSVDGSLFRWVPLDDVETEDGDDGLTTFSVGATRVLPAVPDFPKEGVTTNIDLNAVVNEGMKTMAQAIIEANTRSRAASN